MSRSTKIDETSKSVTGTFALHDFLSISTVSGSINITIDPQPASTFSNAPAELHLDTVSGSIRVTMAPSLRARRTVILERIFQSTIKTMSGSIFTTLIHNEKTLLSTMSGCIEASIYPLSRPSSMSQVELRGVSGSTSMILHPYVDNPQASLKTVSADCSSNSGGVRIYIPSTWEGKVISNVSRDRVRHKWEGLQALENGPYFTAIKGDGPGRLTFSTSSGNVELVGAPPSPGETEVQKGELKPDIPREMKVQKGELKPDIPKERGRQQPTVEEEDDEDDWTMVESEDGGQVPTKRPPPSYDDTMRR